jgi:hypothetical protein
MTDAQTPQTQEAPQIRTYPPGTVEYVKFINLDAEHNTLELVSFIRVVGNDGIIKLMQPVYSRNFPHDQKDEFLAAVANYKTHPDADAPQADGTAYVTMAGW